MSIHRARYFLDGVRNFLLQYIDAAVDLSRASPLGILFKKTDDSPSPFFDTAVPRHIFNGPQCYRCRHAARRADTSSAFRLISKSASPFIIRKSSSSGCRADTRGTGTAFPIRRSWYLFSITPPRCPARRTTSLFNRFGKPYSQLSMSEPFVRTQRSTIGTVTCGCSTTSFEQSTSIDRALRMLFRERRDLEPTVFDRCFFRAFPSGIATQIVDRLTREQVRAPKLKALRYRYIIDLCGPDVG
jgi:hypothetical protein